MRSFKVALCVGTALGGALVFGSNSFAQQQPVAQKPGDENSVAAVVVTARGRAEQLLSVPVSDTAFSSKQLADAHVREVADFINLTPNITIVQAQNVGYSAITIRGITQVRNSESPVSVVVDGVQEVNSYQFTQELFDLESIEVLRGPQGALYGRDAEGGAILITTKQPTDHTEGHIQLGGGSGGEFNAQGVISGPIVADQLYGRLGVNYVDRAGYFNNIYLHDKQDPLKDASVQGLLKWAPNSKFAANLKVSYADTNGSALLYHYEPANLLPNGLLNASNPFGSAPGNANLVSYDFNSRDKPIDHRTLTDVSLRMSDDLGFATLSSVTAYNHVEEFYGGDGYPYANTTTLQLIPGTNLFDADATASQYLDVQAESEEIRLTSRSDQAFRWVVGAYYLYTDRYISTTTGFNNGLGVLQPTRTPEGPSTINPTLSFLGDDNHDTAIAGFVNLDYDLTKQLMLSAGFRYDQDQATQYVSPYNTAGSPGKINQATFGAGQPKFTVTYKALPTLSLYGSWGVGFRSGEFNQNGTAAAAEAAGTPGIGDKVPQEKAETGEIGFKSSFLNNRVSLSGDIYQTDVSNQQYFVFIGSISAQVLVPIDKVQLRGGELEASAILLPGLQVTGGLGVTDSTIEKYTIDPADKGNQAPYVPNLTFNAAVQYRTPITDKLVFVSRADYRLLGKQYWDTENATPRDPVNLVALSMGVEDAQGRWSASIKGDNVLNTKYNAEYVGGGFVEPADPMVIRGELRYNF